MRRQDELKVEHKFPVTEDCYIYVVSCWVVLIVRYLSIQELVSHLCLKHPMYMSIIAHSSPTFLSRTKRILVGNGEYVGVLFVIHVLINLHEY